MTSKDAIAKLNVLSSYDTAADKREEYKECINAILKDLEVLDILKRLDIRSCKIENSESGIWYIECKSKDYVTKEDAIKVAKWKKENN